jgi:hydroxymethylbilane synthase
VKVVFGSRGSDLALTQTKMVINEFKNANPDIEIELRVIRTTGDNQPEAPLEEIGGLGAFTREIELALLAGEIDAAVHSLKDLPTRQPDGLYVAAITKRQCPADAIISNHGYSMESLPEGAVVGTSSLRRKAQLLHLRPDLKIRDLRGNVPTRLRRVRENMLDATILARAGLIRLGLEREHGVCEIPMESMLPAPGQGALALETRSDNTRLRELLLTLHDEATATAVQCERAVLQAFGGGCRAPLGVYAQAEKEHVCIKAFAADMESGTSFCLSRTASCDTAFQAAFDIGTLLREDLAKKNTKAT